MTSDPYHESFESCRLMPTNLMPYARSLEMTGTIAPNHVQTEFVHHIESARLIYLLSTPHKSS